jgi:hypothetical protein
VTAGIKCAKARQAKTKREPDMAEHKHGEMDATENEKTFEGFMKFTTWTVIVILVIIVGMAIFIT